ncbi:unnamed protein product [Linum trigynum]|uniref:Uncharacterized protein n=1 Tax=Linum trigynum TaxID=586398 RepID=A0AAV2F472_9ROSI
MFSSMGKSRSSRDPHHHHTVLNSPIVGGGHGGAGCVEDCTTAEDLLGMGPEIGGGGGNSIDRGGDEPRSVVVALESARGYGSKSRMAFGRRGWGLCRASAARYEIHGEVLQGDGLCRVVVARI